VVAEANAAEAHEELKEEPAHEPSDVVDIDASGAMVEAHFPEHAEDLLAGEAAIATHTEEYEAKLVVGMEGFDTTAFAVSEQQAEPEGETQAAEEEAKPETVAEAAAEAVAAPAQMELIPKPPVDEKAAAKKAEQEKRRKEAEEESPFSVMVDHVYDGPLDLLLDLIRKQDIDIYDIPIAKITAQFLAYVNQLKASDVDVAGEFIYTASLLIHIKSKMLLPRATEGPGEAAEDPRRELVERLLEHEQFKNAAQMLQQKQMMEAASWSNPGYKEFVNDEGAEPEIAADTVDLVRVFREILERARTRPVLDVAEDTVTVGQMIKFLGRRLTMEDKPIALRKLLSHTRSERALIAMFLALLELVRLQAILLRQDKAFSEIFVKKHAAFDSVMNEGLANARDDWR
jgi:segregation and condensation protein A